ncbi:MAG: hypothetical protein K8T10_03380 [Candidatus Eremiobacteraeota bacterium]|nr:hypothetical protein [Candidatus Eremiobacteraeota bacterium]
MEYDSDGTLISSTDPAGWISYYNIESNVTQENDALGRVISSTDEDGNTTYYEYDADGNLLKTTNPNGDISTSTYDSLGRLIETSDFEGNVTRYEYDVMGRTTKITDPDGNETSYEYDDLGRVTKTTYPDETYTETTFDIYGNTKTTRDRSGNITRITLANGEYTDYSYDSLDRLTSEEKKTASNDRIYKIEYKFDNNDAKNGNIHQVIANETDTTTFTYDEMNQLTGITHPDSSTETLTYDNNGNLTQSTNNTTGETTSYEWNCHNRMTKVTLPASGGGTTGEIVEFEYDSDGMLTKMTSGNIERKFTQKGRFATKELVKNSEDEWELSTHHIIHGTMLASYINSVSSNNPATRAKNENNKSETIFYHTDHLGSVRLVTDKNGNTVDSISTDAYGNPLPLTTSIPGAPPGSKQNQGAKMLPEFNFVGTHGIRYVQKIRLHNMRARWYNKTLYRFMSRDLIPNSKSDKFFHKYLYSDMNPMGFLDISGLRRITASDINIMPENYNYNEFKVKICRTLKKMWEICPRLENYFNQIPYYEIGNFDEHASFNYDVSGTHSNTQIDRSSIYIRIRLQDMVMASDLTLAYYLMEEFIHYKQAFNLEGWILRFLMNLTIRPEPGLRFALEDKQEMTGDEVFIETLAKMAVYYASENICKSGEILSLMRRQLTHYHPNSIGLGDFNDPYLILMQRIREMALIHDNFEEINLILLQNTWPWQAFLRYCPARVK